MTAGSVGEGWGGVKGEGFFLLLGGLLTEKGEGDEEQEEVGVGFECSRDCTGSTGRSGI